MYAQADLESLKSDERIDSSCRTLTKIAFRAQPGIAPADQRISKGDVYVDVRRNNVETFKA